MLLLIGRMGGGRQEIKRGWPPIPPHPTHHPVSRPATQPASLPAPGVKGLAIATSGGAPGKEVAPNAAGAHASLLNFEVFEDFEVFEPF